MEGISATTVASCRMVMTLKDMPCIIPILATSLREPLARTLACVTAPVTFIHHKVVPFVQVRAKSIKRNAINRPLVLFGAKLVFSQGLTATSSAGFILAISLDLVAVNPLELLELTLLKRNLVLVPLALLLKHTLKVLSLCSKG